MARLIGFALSILIASALLLSAASSGTAQNQNPMPAIQRKTPLTQNRQESPLAAQAETVSPSETPISQRTKPAVQPSVAHNSPTEIQQDGHYEKPQKFALAALGNIAQTILQLLFTAVATVATVYVAKFTYQLVQVTKEMHTATEAATEAATKSAEAVTLALNAEKPYVFLEPLRVEDRTEQVFDPIGIFTPGGGFAKTVNFKWIAIQLRNRGKGIAIVEEIYIRQCLIELTHRKMDRGERLSILERVIGAGERSETGTRMSVKVTPPIIDTFLRRFAVVGYVRYRDVYERRYKSTFAYFYEPGTILTPQLTYFFLAPNKHNRIIELK